MAILQPTKLQKAFAQDGGRSPIPVDSQVATDGGKASYSDGFPPLTRTPLVAGGIPPKGLDMNGVLYDLSSHIQWMNAGGGYTYDSAYAASIGGYPIGAILRASTGPGRWFNTVDGNVSDPDAGGAGWVGLGDGIASQAEVDAGTNDTKTVTPKKLRWGFAASFTTNGYIAFPSWLGGAILQWGTSPLISAGGTVAQSLPLAFTSVNLCAVCMAEYSSAPNSGYMISIYNRTLTNMSFYNSNTGVANTACWFAIGK